MPASHSTVAAKMAPKDDAREQVLNDYSCYIFVNNTSNQDFLLASSGVNSRYGVWPEGQPCNTIEAKSEEKLHLKDPNGYGGTEGWVKYEVMVGGQRESFTLEFADPQSPWSDNYLKGKSSNPRISISIRPYNNTGHPFYGTVDVSVLDQKSMKCGPRRLISPRALALPPLVEVSEPPVTSLTGPKDDSFQVKFDIGFDVGLGGIGNTKPVHETIAIAAFIQSQIPLPKATVYNNLNDKQWEYFRGLIWNDDPSCYLFEDLPDRNHRFSDGTKWVWDFFKGDSNCMIQRSHFGNLQFLHAMGAHDGAMPDVTRDRLLKWLEVMYKLACGNQGVAEGDKLSTHLGAFFDGSTKPSGESLMRDLLLGSTRKYTRADAQRRALGSCLHAIADSYAIGHTKRRLMNPEDLLDRDEDNYIRFKPGTYGNWGPIMVFHTYRGQESDRHKHYDGLSGGALPTPKDLNSFNSIVGARNAIDACTKLINFFAQKAAWEGDVKKFLETEVFALDSEAKPSDGLVDEHTPLLSSFPRYTDAGSDLEYQAGLQRKLAHLDTGLARESPPASWCRRQRWRCILPPALLALICAAIIVVFIVMGSQKAYAATSHRQL